MALTAHEGDLIEGLREWIRGEDTPEAEATGLFLGELLLKWNAVLNSKFKK